MIRVVIVDDHRIIRDGVRASLEASPLFAVVGEAAAGDEALKVALETGPDVLIVDVAMPGLNGIEFARRWTDGGQPGRILMLSMHTGRDHVVEAFRAGAAGYLLKTASPERIREAVSAVAGGGSFISPEVSGVMIDEVLGSSGAAGPLLSPREREVLQYIANGQNAKEIAAELGISDKTVHAFRIQVMRKLKLNSVAELTKYAIRHGLTTLG